MIGTMNSSADPSNDSAFEPMAAWRHGRFSADLVGTVFRTAREAPGRPAVIEPGGSLSYGSLAGRARQLASAMAGRGVVRSDRIGIHLPPSADAVTAIIGTLMLSAAYVPLDPQQPVRRTRAMLENCGARLCLTQQPVASANCPVLVAGELADQPWQPDTGSFQGEPFHPEDVAYVIHTSGSTGVPKGVQIEHRSAHNLVAELDRLAPVQSAHRGSWWTRPSFDVSIWESWGPLTQGGTVVVVPDECRLEGPRLAEFLTRAEISSAYIPGPFLPDLIDHWRREPKAGTALTRMLVGVEPIPRGILQDLMELRPGLTVVNGYGPAETTICCTLYVVPRSGGDRSERTPIGRAVPGNRLYVLGEDGQPTSAGAGELAVAGIGVSRGYLGTSATESGRFISEPGGAGRCYRTGDLVRILPDGNLAFEGRADRQLKVRGYRVEPGEVEAALRESAPLQDVVVAGRQEAGGSRVISAYVVPAPGTTFDRSAVVERLREVLPAWAVPAVMIVVDRIPVTSNGKIDHETLSALEPQTHRGDSRAPVAARTGTERRLLDIWQDVLGVTQLGVRDGLFDLGGHSLSAARICARVRAEFGCELSVADLLTAPTVEEFAGLVDAADKTDQGFPVGPVPTGTPFPLSFCQERMWLHDQMHPDGTDYNLFEAHRVYGTLDSEALRAALGDVIRRHLVLRTTFHAERGVPYQVVAEDLVTPFEAIDCAAFSDERIREIVARQARHRFRLHAGPLLRMTLLRLEPGLHVLQVVAHHIVADDWSMDVFWTDLRACYQVRAAGTEPYLAPLEAQAVHYATWQRGPAYAGRVSADLEFWRSELAQAPLVLDLPADFPRAEPASVDAVVEFTMPHTAWRGLADLAVRMGATTYMALLAAFVVTVTVTAGQDEFVLATFTGQRESAQLEPLMGMFVNTLALRMRCTGDPTFAELLGRVRSTVLGAFRHQRLPFDRLVAAIRPPRDLTRHPIAQVGFQSLVAHPDRPALPGTKSTPFAAGQGGNVLDILATVEERAERLTGHVHYRADLFTAATARDLADRYTQTIEAVARDPHRRLSELR
jgi:amino acid adenylation domain-containing protein